MFNDIKKSLINLVISEYNHTYKSRLNPRDYTLTCTYHIANVDFQVEIYSNDMNNQFRFRVNGFLADNISISKIVNQNSLSATVISGNDTYQYIVDVTLPFSMLSRNDVPKLCYGDPDNYALVTEDDQLIKITTDNQLVHIIHE